jgi:hypothetical protein
MGTLNILYVKKIELLSILLALPLQNKSGSKATFEKQRSAEPEEAILFLWSRSRNEMRLSQEAALF